MQLERYVKWLAPALCAACALTGTAGAQILNQALPPLPIPESYVPRYECVRNFYVDPNRGAAWTAYADGGGSPGEPWKSMQDANDAQANGAPVLRAGDCVNLAPGLYTQTATITLTRGGDANATNGYVVYRASTPRTAHLLAARKFYAMIDVKTAYVIIDGLEIDGNNATNDGEGLAVSGDARHHHVVIENSIIHGNGGGGVQMNDSEYFWVVRNLIYRNAATNTYQESGVSIYQPQAAADFTATPADAALAFHIVIAGNVSRDNIERIPCGEHPGCHTDGNGIIIDKTLNVDREGGAPYAGRTLVVANAAFGNGGAGVHVFLSEHVTLANNTAFNNHLDLQNSGAWRGELSNVDSNDILWVNNIGWAQPGQDGVTQNNSAVLVANTPGHATQNVTWTNNMTYGGDVRVFAPGWRFDSRANQVNRMPGLADAFHGDLRPTQNSRVRAAGAAQPYLTNAAPNIGAY
ncbi:MAG TPA: right-handed parallel beta-helix repeat-containing protein [Caulobacterales bacterium]|nr:right-handed parallel beta-helix repeat-containing protein [Caulobacterales bacterium]